MRAIASTFAFAIAFTASLSFADPAGDRESARFILEKHCGECHREDSPRANPKALAIFNLNKPDFAATMSKLQLADATGRLKNLLPSPTDDAKAVHDEFGTFGGITTPDEIKSFEAFVKAELKRRAQRH
jgi:hypothetical protein